MNVTPRRVRRAPYASGWRNAAHAPDLWRDIMIKRFGPFEVDINDAVGNRPLLPLAASLLVFFFCFLWLMVNKPSHFCLP